MSMYLTVIIHVYVSDRYIFFELLIKIMRIVEALENRGFRVPLMKEEADLYERLVAIIKQVSFLFPVY